MPAVKERQSSARMAAEPLQHLPGPGDQKGELLRASKFDSRGFPAFFDPQTAGPGPGLLHQDKRGCEGTPDWLWGMPPAPGSFPEWITTTALKCEKTAQGRFF